MRKSSIVTTLIAATGGLCLALFSAQSLAKIGDCNAPIVFGTTISETGPFSSYTQGWRKMTEIFAQEIDKTGGIEVRSCHKKVPIKFVIYDDQSVPSKAVQLYQKMATVDKVDFFVGPDWSAVAGPVPPIAEKHKIPLVAGNVATPAFFHRGLKYFWATPVPTVPRWSERYFDMLSKMNPKPKSIFFVTQDNPVTKAISGFWTKKAVARGLKLVGNEVFPSNLKDFTSIIARMRAAKPDVIYISSFDGPAGPLVQQMRQFKVHALDVHDSILSGGLEREVGAKGIEGMTGELAWLPGVKAPYSHLIEKVLKRAHINIFDDNFITARIDCYLVMIQAIEKAGAINREKVKEALYKGRFKSPNGPIDFNKYGAPNTTAFTFQMQNGKPQVVWPPKSATAKLIWPSPSWQ